MNQRTYRRLMKGIDPSKPDYQALFNIFMSALAFLKPDPSELLRLSVAFHISFYGHKNQPIRDDGSAYFLHPFQIALRVIAKQRHLGIRSIELIIVVLLHDCFEEALDDGVSPLLIRAEVAFRLQDRTAYSVYCLTKQRRTTGKETGDEHFVRLKNCGDIIAIAGKFDDRENNGLTLSACGDERAYQKILETYRWFLILKHELAFLIEREIQARRLPVAWRRVPQFLYDSLMRVMRVEKKRLKKKGFKFT